MDLNQAWSLLVVALGAALLPGISQFLRLPGVVLEILFGVILGKSLLNLTFSGEWLPFLAQLGFLLLMFQAGMEIDVAMLRRQSKGQLFFHLAVFALTLVFSYIAAELLGKGIYVVLVLSTTSLGLVVPALKEAGIGKTATGQSLLIAATLADFLTLFGITFFVLWNQYGMSWRFLLPLPLFAGFAVLLKLGRLWAWWHPHSAARLLAPQDHQELGVRISLALLFFFIALSELVHLEPVLGAFMGGAVLAVVFREKEHLESKLSGIGYGFLIPLFFINVGMSFDLTSILTWPRIVFTLKLLVAALLVKFLPSLLFVFNGISLRKTLSMGALLSSRLSLIIVAATIGVNLGLISIDFKDAIILLAVMTCLLGPSLFKVLSPPDDESRA
jgi:Kef-type K+ transport system membrane component KefB